MLQRLGFLYRRGEALIPDPDFFPKMIAQAASSWAGDGEIHCGIPLGRMHGWRPSSYGMLDLREIPTFVERSEGCSHDRHQRKVMDVRKSDPVIPAIRVGGAIWMDHSMEARRSFPEMASIPDRWRMLAAPPPGGFYRAASVVEALAAYVNLYHDHDITPYVDAKSPLGGILHVPASTNVVA